MIIFNHKKKGFPLKPEAFQGKPHEMLKKGQRACVLLPKEVEHFRFWNARRHDLCGHQFEC